MGLDKRTELDKIPTVPLECWLVIKFLPSCNFLYWYLKDGNMSDLMATEYLGGYYNPVTLINTNNAFPG